MREPEVGDLGTGPAFVSNPSKRKEAINVPSEPVTALRAEFVIKPGNEERVRETIELMLANSFCRDRQFLHALVLVSEMESRLVTVLTFWQSGGFAEARERRVIRMRQKLAPLLDQSLRVQSFTAHVMDGRTSFEKNEIGSAAESFAPPTEAIV